MATACCSACSSWRVQCAGSWGKRVIGITGSAGKTTTKEAVAQVLERAFQVLKSQGNLNNGFGLPLQLLRLEPEHDVAVIEMGMNHAGEIAALARIAEPDWAVVSNVAPVHLEHFADGIAGIARAKYELVRRCRQMALPILNCDDEHVARFGEGMGERAVFYGTGECAAVRAVQIAEIGADGRRFYRDGARRTRQRAAASAGPAQRPQCTGGDCGWAAQRDDRWRSVRLRSARCEPATSAARSRVARRDRYQRQLQLQSACAGCNGRRVARDAGGERWQAHRGRRRDAGTWAWKARRCTGPAVSAWRNEAWTSWSAYVDWPQALVDGATQRGVEAIFVATPEEAGAWLKANLRPDDAVLLKASRGVRLERALASLTNEA